MNEEVESNTEETPTVAPLPVLDDEDTGDTDSYEDTPQDLTYAQEEEAQLKAIELESLKAAADRLGVSYHTNIGTKKLSDRIASFMEASDRQEQIDGGQAALKKADLDKGAAPIEDTFAKAKADALSLVRIQISCMDPMKKEYEYQPFTAGNSVVGTVTKVVPFHKPFHVPRIIYNVIKNTMYQSWSTEKLLGGGERKVSRQERAFVVNELEPLTKEELDKLKRAQLAMQAA